MTNEARARLCVMLAFAILAGGCSGDPPPGPPPRSSGAGGPMPPGVVARVGGTEIHGEAVARIAAAQGVSLQVARDRAVQDALFAEEARARGIDAAPDVELAVSAALARAALRDLQREARARGPVTDEELRVTTERHWLDLDRPEAFRTVHAVARLDEKAPEAKRKAAAAVAEALAQAARGLPELGATTEVPRRPEGAAQPEDALVAELRRLSATVPHDGIEVVVEALPPVTADARVLAGDGSQLDPAFSAGAAKLSTRGEVSPPVTSKFGVHVIVLLEKIPAHVVPVEERRALVYEEVMTDRARAAKQQLAAAAGPIALERNVDALLALVAVEQRSEMAPGERRDVGGR